MWHYKLSLVSLDDISIASASQLTYGRGNWSVAVGIRNVGEQANKWKVQKTTKIRAIIGILMKRELTKRINTDTNNA